MFIHIPLVEYINLYNNKGIYGTKGEAICCQSMNTGLLGAIIEQNITQWVLCGHDHDNDYYGDYNGINLGFGRKTGHGGYGPDVFQRGARIFEVQTNGTINTWVR